MIDVVWHEACLGHDTGYGLFETEPPPWLAVPEIHVESNERILNMHSALVDGPLAGFVRPVDGRLATRKEIAAVHDPKYLEEIERACETRTWLTRTTVVAPGSFEAALGAAGSAMTACERVLDGATSAAYALVRPPGHHAGRATADGYCLFNNTALAADLAVRRGEERVAIIDWDVHHGNGTQSIFYDRGDVLTVSLHMDHGSWSPTSHPETGQVDERGQGDGLGANVNLPLPLGTGDEGYLAAFDRVVAPVVDRFSPSLILVACGQDASQFDPNGRQSVTVAGFRALGARVRELAARHTGGRVVLVQEGGYGRTYSSLCLAGTLEGVLGLEARTPDPVSFLPDVPGKAEAVIAGARRAHGIG